MHLGPSTVGRGFLCAASLSPHPAAGTSHQPVRSGLSYCMLSCVPSPRLVHIPLPSGRAPLQPQADGAFRLSSPGECRSQPRRLTGTATFAPGRPSLPQQLVLRGAAVRVSGTAPRGSALEKSAPARQPVRAH